MVSRPAQSLELDIRLEDALRALCSVLRNALDIDHTCAPISALAALYNPHLFSSLILVDPVLTIPQWPGTPMPSFSHLLSLSALPRRNGWSSRYHHPSLRHAIPYSHRHRSEALKLFQKNPFFMSWDPSVLRVYVKCGLYAPPSAQTPPEQSFKLKMPPIHESIVFDDTHTSCEAFANISNLDSRIRLRWIIPGVDNPEEYVRDVFIMADH